MELTELHLSDSMVELLKSGRINNRLLCEIATHEDFVTLMTDTEIYVMVWQPPTSKISTAFWKCCGRKSFPNISQ